MKKVSKLSVLAVFSILGFSTLISSCAKKISDEEVKIYAVIHDEEAKALTELFTKKTVQHIPTIDSFFDKLIHFFL